MICRVEVKGFRALQCIRTDLERFQLMVGPNASGKSTFFDVMNLLRDTLNAGIEAAVMGNQRQGIIQRAARGRDLTWMREGEHIEIALAVRLPEHVSEVCRYCRYEVAFSVAPQLSVHNENFWLCPAVASKTGDDRQAELVPRHSKSVITSPGSSPPKGWRGIISKLRFTGNYRYRSETSDKEYQVRPGPGRLALEKLSEDEREYPAAIWFKRFLAEGIQRLTLNAEAMRLPCAPGMHNTFAPDGSNMPWVIRDLKSKDPGRMREWVTHLRTALPDLEDVSIKLRKDDQYRYLVLKHRTGLEAPSWVVSDGTLRLLALTLLAYAPDTPGLVVIEEPENGIHPQAVEAVFESLSSIYERQVFCATHSPVMIGLAKPRQILCFAKSKSGAVNIVRGDQHPRLRNWQGTMVLGDLFAAGVLS